MTVAIVVLNWNGVNLLKQFLPALERCSHGAQIYVADNASTDGSVSFLKDNHPQIKLINIPKNLGYAGGYNYALRHVEEDLYILLNSDVEVTENWLMPIVQYFKQHPDTAIAQPKIKSYRNPEYFEYAGAAGGLIDSLGYPFCRGRIFQEIEKDEGQYDEDCSIFWASGACLCIRKHVYWEVGALDELYFAHQEEIDLCWRTLRAGHDIKYIAQSEVYHVGSATLSTEHTNKTFLNFRNSLFNLAKNKNNGAAIPSIFLRLLLDGLVFFLFLCQGKPAHAWAIIRAHFSFYRYLPKVLEKKNQFKQKFKPSPSVISIVWLYFCRGRKQYRDF